MVKKRAAPAAAERGDVPRAAWVAGETEATTDHSPLINKELVLFLFQLELDAQLQRALTYEKFEDAKALRERRTAVDEALASLREMKGAGCGTRAAAARHGDGSGTAQYAPEFLSLRGQMQAAVEQERYTDAASLRDRLAELEARASETAAEAAEAMCGVAEPRFVLGEMVLHTEKGYRGVIAGWDCICCEGPAWQDAAGVSTLRYGPDQVFYHVLADCRDWPAPQGEEGAPPPVAYVAEECLAPASSADFAAEEPLVGGALEHPYGYLMFLGADGEGNMVPCRQLRDKYGAARRDVHLGGDGEAAEGDEDGSSGQGGGGIGPDGGRGPTRLPGIDMRSLE